MIEAMMREERLVMERHDSVAYIRLAGGEEVRLTIGKRLHAGCERTAFESDFEADGRRFILKRADNDEGAESNRFEYAAYHFLAYEGHEYADHMPTVAGISDSGTWLLMERCIPAYHAHNLDYMELPFEKFGVLSVVPRCNALGYDLFPDAFHDDLHAQNWGYTEKGHRPVVFDLAHRQDGREFFSNGLATHHYNETTNQFERSNNA